MLVDAAAARIRSLMTLSLDYAESGVLMSHLCKALCVSHACIRDGLDDPVDLSLGPYGPVPAGLLSPFLPAHELPALDNRSLSYNCIMACSPVLMSFCHNLLSVTVRLKIQDLFNKLLLLREADICSCHIGHSSFVQAPKLSTDMRRKPAYNFGRDLSRYTSTVTSGSLSASAGSTGDARFP